MLANPDGVGDGSEGWVHRADARKEARVDYVKVVDLVGLAVDVEHRRRRVGAEAARARLVGHTGDRDVHAHVEVLVQDVVLGEQDPLARGREAVGEGPSPAPVPMMMTS